MDMLNLNYFKSEEAIEEYNKERLNQPPKENYLEPTEELVAKIEA
jgi:hypothetical protein